MRQGLQTGKTAQLPPAGHQSFAQAVRDAADPDAGPAATSERVRMKHEGEGCEHATSAQSPELEGADRALTPSRQKPSTPSVDNQRSHFKPKSE